MTFIERISIEVSVVMRNEAQGHEQHTTHEKLETDELSPAVFRPA
jgi:hypothetical protein